MSEDFAVTCAQILPVLALALLVTLEVVRRQVNKVISKVNSWKTFFNQFQIFGGIFWYVVWAWLMFRIVDAETSLS